MRKLTLFFIFFTSLITVSSVTAQNDGFAGKRLHIFVTPVYGIKSVFTSAGLECLLFREWSVVLGINYFNSKEKQTYKSNLFIDENYNYKIPDKARITTRSAFIEVRHYTTAPHKLPAPFGFYYYGCFKYGVMDVEGNYYRGMVYYLDGTAYNDYISYTYKNLKTYGFETGVGYNLVFKSKFTAGLKTGLNFNKVKPSVNVLTDKILSGIENSLGTNLFGIGLNTSHQNIFTNIGLSIYGEIGILIF